jgi:hypothetical protein
MNAVADHCYNVDEAFTILAQDDVQALQVLNKGGNCKF